ncbi:MAG: hypothetical protein JWO36_269 [Myxococcales bacterium]|nr:hypothetical protein [Myxococcales bacterium]
MLAFLVGCMEPHAPASVEIALHDCYACHRPQYEAASNHVGNRPTTCASCHRLVDWHGLNPGTHPEAAFVISQGPHKLTLCAECHDPDVSPDSTNGANVTCVGCHTGAHDMTPMTAKHADVGKFHWDPARPTFCRDCHPLGLNN